MIRLPLSTPDHLLRHLPHYIVSNLSEARALLAALEHEEDWDLAEFVTAAHLYSSEYEAFRELYPGDIDDFKREKCEDYESCITDFSTHYTSWLEANVNPIYLSENKILILEH